MSDPTETVVSTYTTIIVVATVVPLVITGIGLIAVFAYKRRRERDFVPPSLANMPGNMAGNLPTTTPALPVQVRHVRNARSGTLLEWPSSNPGLTSPDASQQVPGTHPTTDPAGGMSNASPNALLDPEARRNVRPELLPTPYNMAYSAAQPLYPVQSQFIPANAAAIPQAQPFLPQPPSSPFPTQLSYMTPQSHPTVPGQTAIGLATPQVQRAVSPRVLMLVNDDASRSTSPSQATDDGSSTLRGPRSIGSFSTVGEPVPQYEPVDSAVLTEEPEQVANLRTLGRQGTMLPRYSQTNPFRRPTVAAPPAQ
ncbi:hypothetical protein L226DRAFT_615624 [Lentinus tigrinus ALCF2SS1-7]|uniref:Uncharacterized protein n=1 Tax=Lentinus tigrinus ALCF2SS1-6 TaxID=1328759 RepID=A0A5C2RUJ7_9APHY|nr:hypothetical protein L227DRAFT_615450 [Lentinus tigrinus ALCF2SS1-6]RPD71352.1 hypothetical protein L226DRAFT_615624 [Lentinus tigrinus ALCF2SS1-7]